MFLMQILVNLRYLNVLSYCCTSRYFSKQELRELFILDNPHHSATQVQLNQLHSDERKSDVSLDEHIAFLHSLNIFGISDHDLMFSKDIVDETEDNDEAAVSHDYIKKQVLNYMFMDLFSSNNMQLQGYSFIILIELF